MNKKSNYSAAQRESIFMDNSCSFRLITQPSDKKAIKKNKFKNKQDHHSRYRRTAELLKQYHAAEISGQRRKCTDITWEIALLNERLIHSIAQRLFALCRCAERAMELDELKSAGYDGMCYAVSKFSPDRGCKFSTYAYHQVFSSMLCYIQHNNGVIPVPLYKQHKLHMIKKAAERLCKRGVEPGTAMIAREMSCTEKEIEELQLLPSSDISIDSSDLCAGELRPLLETVPNDNAERPDSTISENMQADSLKDFLQAVLTERQYRVISLRYGLDDTERDGKTLQQIGIALSLTRERVRQIEQEAFQLLRLFCTIDDDAGDSPVVDPQHLIGSLNTMPCLMENKYSFKLVAPDSGQPLLLQNKHSFSLVRPEHALPVIMHNRHSFRFVKPVMVKPAVRRKWFKSQAKGKTPIQHAALIKNLNKQEQSVLEYRYGLSGQTTKTLREIADILKITLLAVWKTEQKALEKLLCEWASGQGCWAEMA